MIDSKCTNMLIGNNATLSKCCIWHKPDFTVCLSVKVLFSIVLKVRWTSLKMLEALQGFTASRMNSNGRLVWKNLGSWTRDQFYWCWQCQGQCIYPDHTSHWRTQSLITKGHISLICFMSLILQKINWAINGRPLISHVNKSSVQLGQMKLWAEDVPSRKKHHH